MTILLSSTELFSASQVSQPAFLTTLWSLYFVLPSSLPHFSPFSVSKFIIPEFELTHEVLLLATICSTVCRSSHVAIARDNLSGSKN